MPKRRHAAALSYDSERGGAPRVVAAGSGVVAERIIALAVRERRPDPRRRGPRRGPRAAAARGEEPEELWAAVAEALVWAYKLTSRRRLASASARRPRASSPPNERRPRRSGAFA